MFAKKNLLKLLSSVALSTALALSPMAVRPHFEGIYVPMAEAAQPRKVPKLTATQLMTKMEQSLVLISQRLKKRPAKERARSAPLVKALVETSRVLKAVKLAAKAKNNKQLAKALPKASSAIARLDNAYRLSGIKAKEVSVGVTSLKKLWQDYLKRSPGSKAGASKQKAVANARRIAAMRRQLADLQRKRDRDARASWEIREMERRLELADRANQSLANQWVATIILAEVFGIYSGYYDYVVIYHPDDVIYYRDSYTYFSAQVEYSYVEYYSYYESYSWSSYDRPYVVSDVYDFDMSRREYQRFESSYVSTYERYETVTETTIVSREEIQRIDTESSQIQSRAASIQTAADIPDAEADKVEVVNDDPAPDVFLESVDQTPQEALEPPADTTAVEPAAEAAQPDATQAEEPQAEEPKAEEPQAEEPKAEEPQAEEPQAEEPQAEEPQAEEPQVEEPQVEEPQAEEPQAEEPQAEEPQAEEPQVEEPQVEEPQAEEPQAEEPQAEEPQAEEPQAEEPQVEEPQAEEPQVEEQQAEPEPEPQVEEQQPEPEPEPQVEEQQPEPEPEPQVEEQQPEPEPEPQYEEPAPEPEPEPQYEEPAQEEQAPAVCADGSEMGPDGCPE